MPSPEVGMLGGGKGLVENSGGVSCFVKSERLLRQPGEVWPFQNPGIWMSSLAQISTV